MLLCICVELYYIVENCVILWRIVGFHGFCQVESIAMKNAKERTTMFEEMSRSVVVCCCIYGGLVAGLKLTLQPLQSL